MANRHALLRLAAYLVVTAAVAFALEVHNRDDVREVRRLHAQFCHSFLTVRENQIAVLKTLGEWSRVFGDRTKVGLKPVPGDFTSDISERIRVLQKQTCTP